MDSTNRHYHRLMARLLPLFAAALVCGVGADAQSASLTDEGPTGSGSTYFASDGWLISVTGASAYAGVDMCDPSGCTSGGFYGDTDGSGNFSLGGTFASGDSGSWSETWCVGDGSCASRGSPDQVGSTLSFYVGTPTTCSVSGASPGVVVAASVTYQYLGMYDWYGYPGFEAVAWSSGEDSDAGSTSPSPTCEITDTFDPSNGIVAGDQTLTYTSDSWDFYANIGAYTALGQITDQSIYDNNWYESGGMDFNFSASSFSFIADNTVSGPAYSHSASSVITVDLTAYFQDE